MRELEKMLYTVKTDDKLFTTHYTNVGILSDKVGAGKSYCITGLINEKKNIDLVSLPYRVNNKGSSQITFKTVKNKLNTNILLVSHGLVGQWEKYLITSGLKHMVIRKTKDVYNVGKNSFFSKLNTKISNDGNISDNNEDQDEDDENCKKTQKNNAKGKSNAKRAATTKTDKSKSAKEKIVVNTKNTVSKDIDAPVVGTTDPVIKKKLVISRKKKSEDDQQPVETEQDKHADKKAEKKVDTKSDSQIDNDVLKAQKELEFYKSEKNRLTLEKFNMETEMNEIRITQNELYDNRRKYKLGNPEYAELSKLINDCNTKFQTNLDK
jgi:hypothetical protein